MRSTSEEDDDVLEHVGRYIMKRSPNPLWIGLVGLLVTQVACSDSPFAPNGATEPERSLEVFVTNAGNSRAFVSMELGGIPADLGTIDAGKTDRFVVTSPALGRGGPVHLVAVAVMDEVRLAAQALTVESGWTVEVSLAEGAAVARAFGPGADPCAGGSTGCVR